MSASLKPAHFPQLDGLRALAVLLVIASHTLPWCQPLGECGVRLFFVLSGFLITGILLELRGADLLASLRVFYARRSLRIVPLYLLAIAVCWIWGLPELSRCWPWLLTYTSNIQLAVTGYWGQGVFNHFWSLAVEEQFYLLWPFLMLLPAKRFLPWIIGGCILMAILLRSVVWFIWWGHDKTAPVTALYQMPACMDSLAVGGWLAWRRWSSLPALDCGALFLIAVSLIGASTVVMPQDVLYRLGESTLSLMFISRAIECKQDLWDRFLQWKPLTSIGVISYGLYVWHGIVYPLLLDKPSVGGFFAVLAVSWFMALVSWYWVEKFFNQLRHQFPYPSVK